MKPIHLILCLTCFCLAMMLATPPAVAQCGDCTGAVVWTDTETLATTVVATTATASEVRTAHAGPVRRVAAARPIRRAVVASGRIVCGVGRVALAPFRLFRCRR